MIIKLYNKDLHWYGPAKFQTTIIIYTVLFSKNFQ